MILGAFFVGVIFTGCRCNSTYSNRDPDRREGEAVITQFYGYLKSENYQGAFALFSEKFFTVTDTQKLRQILTTTRRQLGAFDSYSVEQWQTQSVVGTDSRTDYLFICDVKRANFPAKEKIVLTKESSGIKIISYHVNSDGFFRQP